MPLLPDYANLEYNPDSIIFASKSLSRTALNNIRSPTGEDETYLKEKTFNKQLSTNFDEFSDVINEFYNQFEVLVNFPTPDNEDEAYDILTKLKTLNAIVRKGKTLFVSKIKPYARDLSLKNIKDLKQINDYLNNYMTDQKFIDLVVDFANINYGNISFKMFIDNLSDLTEQTAIAINSINQNEPALTGSGRNLFGEKISQSGDIPTIWNNFAKNCPTKYLL
jgi:hypothetical protein